MKFLVFYHEYLCNCNFVVKEDFCLLNLNLQKKNNESVAKYALSAKISNIPMFKVLVNYFAYVC